ncbi:hypothetical protein P7C70_g440, partial [Phenoliferia sp. Uapishka_3]
FGGGQGNDGVFANLSAKPDGGRRGEGPEFVGGDDGGDGDKDEVPPAYEVAALDSTPPYWETTVITPQGLLGPDDICVDGLPVGSPFGFAWNLLVSMSFQFVGTSAYRFRFALPSILTSDTATGFLLTYLLHTTHAAKNGSRAGLGITLIQLGFYLKERVDHPEFLEGPGDATGLEGSAGPNTNPEEMTGWAWWGGAVQPEDLPGSALATSTFSALGSLPTQLHGALSGALDASDPDAPRPTMPSLGNLTSAQMTRMDQTTSEYMSFFLVLTGSFLLIGGYFTTTDARQQSMSTLAPGPGSLTPLPSPPPLIVNPRTPSSLSTRAAPPASADDYNDFAEEGESPTGGLIEDSDEAMEDVDSDGGVSADGPSAVEMGEASGSGSGGGQSVPVKPSFRAYARSGGDWAQAKLGGAIGGGGKRSNKADRGSSSKAFTTGTDGERQELNKVLDKDYKGKRADFAFLTKQLLVLTQPAS